MKIALQQEISREHPEDRILVISDFNHSDMSSLRDQIVGMVQGPGGSECEVGDGGSGARLHLVVGDVDQGVVVLEGTPDFLCTLTVESWLAVAGMLSSLLTANLCGFQWLYDLPGNDIELLVSRDGRW
jgi:hypothetical protein